MYRVVFLFVFVCFFTRIQFLQSFSNCKQAWNGGGTGAWYRVDTACSYSFVSTKISYCLPIVIIQTNQSKNNDGFYISLGIFNRVNGFGLDIGLTYDTVHKRWVSYANDARGWKYGSISVDGAERVCYQAILYIMNGSISYQLSRKNDSTIIGTDILYSNEIDPNLNLTSNSSDFGIYRFESIAQVNETLNTGSSLLYVVVKDWSLVLHSGEIVSPNPTYIAPLVYGYPPGPCCTNREINTIHVYEEIRWQSSNITISYFN